MRNTYLCCLGITLLLVVLPALRVDAQESSADVEALLKRIDENTDKFKKSLDSALDESKINDSKAEDEINGYVKDFKDATSKLHDQYKDAAAAPDSAREVLVRAQRIDQFMKKYPLGAQAEGDWQVVRSDLETLAKLYKLKWSS